MYTTSMCVCLLCAVRTSESDAMCRIFNMGICIEIYCRTAINVKTQYVDTHYYYSVVVDVLSCIAYNTAQIAMAK